jgi:hypothetical protein
MPRLFTHHSPAGMSGGERVFMDDRGRLGSAAPVRRDAPAGALVLRPGSAWRRGAHPSAHSHSRTEVR